MSDEHVNHENLDTSATSLIEGQTILLWQAQGVVLQAAERMMQASRGHDPDNWLGDEVEEGEGTWEMVDALREQEGMGWIPTHDETCEELQRATAALDVAVRNLWDVQVRRSILLKERTTDVTVGRNRRAAQRRRQVEGN